GERPPRWWRGGRTSLVRRVPDHGEDAVVVLAGRAAEVGVQLARSELGRCERQTHIVLAAGLTAPDPARTDLDALRDDPEVGVGLDALVAVRDDIDVGADRDGLELALVAAIVVLGDVSDCSHGLSSCCSRGADPLAMARP